MRRTAPSLPPVGASALLTGLLLAGPFASPSVAGPPPVPGVEWTVSRPAELGLDPERLARGVERVGSLPGARSLLVVKDGAVVAEETFGDPGSTRRPHNLKSASKSLLSALVGISIARGEIPGVDATVGELLPGYTEALPEEKRRITLRDLLTMEAGLASTSQQHYGAWVATPDWTAGALARPMASEPGTRFTYSTGNTHLVAAILTEVTGRPLLGVLRERLLEPIGAAVAGWDRSPEGYYFGGNNLSMSPRDLARFGLLYLRGGEWAGEPVVPADWVEASTRRHAEGWPERYGAYGYFWWLPPDDPWGSYAAVGYGGQFLYVVPELDMLVVMTSTIEGKGEAWDRRAFRIFREDVFGAAL